MGQTVLNEKLSIHPDRLAAAKDSLSAFPKHFRTIGPQSRPGGHDEAKEPADFANFNKFLGMPGTGTFITSTTSPDSSPAGEAKENESLHFVPADNWAAQALTAGVKPAPTSRLCAKEAASLQTGRRQCPHTEFSSHLSREPKLAHRSYPNRC